MLMQSRHPSVKCCVDGELPRGRRINRGSGVASRCRKYGSHLLIFRNNGYKEVIYFEKENKHS